MTSKHTGIQDMKAYLILTVAVFCSTISGAPYSYKSGPFTVLFDPENLPTLQVVQTGRLVPVVWRTSNTSKTLISAYEVEEDVEQNGGDFVFSPKTLEQCTDMKITENGTRSTAQVGSWFCSLEPRSSSPRFYLAAVFLHG